MGHGPFAKLPVGYRFLENRHNFRVPLVTEYFPENFLHPRFGPFKNLHEVEIFIKQQSGDPGVSVVLSRHPKNIPNDMFLNWFHGSAEIDKLKDGGSHPFIKAILAGEINSLLSKSESGIKRYASAKETQAATAVAGTGPSKASAICFAAVP